MTGRRSVFGCAKGRLRASALCPSNTSRPSAAVRAFRRSKQRQAGGDAMQDRLGAICVCAPDANLDPLFSNSCIPASTRKPLTGDACSCGDGGFSPLSCGRYCRELGPWNTLPFSRTACAINLWTNYLFQENIIMQVNSQRINQQKKAYLRIIL